MFYLFSYKRVINYVLNWKQTNIIKKNIRNKKKSVDRISISKKITLASDLDAKLEPKLFYFCFLLNNEP